MLCTAGLLQAAEDTSRDSGQKPEIYLHREKASLYQIENENDYIFIVHATATATVDGRPCMLLGRPLDAKEARLFKGPLDDLRELICVTGFSSGSEKLFDIVTKVGKLSVDKKQWEDSYENVFNLIHIRKEGNQDIFDQVVLKKETSETIAAQKLEKAGLSPTTDLTPKSRLYQVEGQDKYFFVGFKKEKYFVDENNSFKHTTHSERCYIPTEDYVLHLFFGEYPKLYEKSTLESLYPLQSFLGPFHIIPILVIGTNCTGQKLNLMKNQWTDSNEVVHKVIHVKKEGNEEFFKKLEFIKK